MSTVPNYDLLHGNVIDYMHYVLLGMTKMCLKLWFDSENSRVLVLWWPGKQVNYQKYHMGIVTRDGLQWICLNCGWFSEHLLNMLQVPSLYCCSLMDTAHITNPKLFTLPEKTGTLSFFCHMQHMKPSP